PPRRPLYQRRATLLQCPSAEDDREARPDRVRVIEVLRRAAADQVDVGPEACGSEGRQDLDRLLPRAIPDRDDVRIEGPRRLDRSFRLRGHDEAVETEGEPGLRDGLAAEDLREPVSAPPAGALLRPEVRRLHLEDHPGVIIEPATDAHV